MRAPRRLAPLLWGRAIVSDRSTSSERLIRVGGLLYILGLLCLAAGLVGAVTGTFPLWWGLLAASLCALAAHRVMRYAASRMIGPATSPAQKQAKKELIRRVLAGDAELEAHLEAYLLEHRSDDAERGEGRDAPAADA